VALQRHRPTYGITKGPEGRQPSVTFRTGDSQERKKNGMHSVVPGGQSFYHMADRFLDNTALSNVPVNPFN